MGMIIKYFHKGVSYMYFGRSLKKIKKIINEENIIVDSKYDAEQKDILKVQNKH